MTILFLKRYWAQITILLIIILSLGAIKWYGANQYNKGVAVSTAVMQAKLDVINAAQEKRFNEASSKYQAEKTVKDKQNEVRYVTVEKIILEPIYLNNCIDDNGLSAINSAISAD